MVVLYWTPHFLHWINSINTKIKKKIKKKKLTLDETCDTKLNSNWIPIWNLIPISKLNKF